MQLEIDNWRWAGVPFYIRTGKHLSQRNTEIAIRFKQAPYAAFQDTPVDALRPNWLVLRIAPDAGISLQFEVKRPGPVVDLAAVKMDFRYQDWFPKEPNVGYETLLYDVMIGDQTLFMRADIVEHRLHDAPSVLHDVGAHEQRLIADHDIVEQGLESDIRLLGEPVLVAEVHLDGGEINNRSRALDFELQGNAGIGRDAQHQPVGPQGVDRRVLECRIGRLLETDRYLRIPLRQVLAGSDVEGHAGPAPIVDLELHGDIGLDARGWRHVRFLPIRLHHLAAHPARTVLAPHH